MVLYLPNFSLVFLIHVFLYAGVYCISLRTKYEIASEESRENQAAILFPAFQPGLNCTPG